MLQRVKLFLNFFDTDSRCWPDKQYLSIDQKDRKKAGVKTPAENYQRRVGEPHPEGCCSAV
jgi:hypothetical protein